MTLGCRIVTPLVTNHELRAFEGAFAKILKVQHLRQEALEKLLNPWFSTESPWEKFLNLWLKNLFKRISQKNIFENAILLVSGFFKKNIYRNIPDFGQEILEKGFKYLRFFEEVLKKYFLKVQWFFQFFNVFKYQWVLENALKHRQFCSGNLKKKN